MLAGAIVEARHRAASGEREAVLWALAGEAETLRALSGAVKATMTLARRLADAGDRLATSGGDRTKVPALLPGLAVQLPEPVVRPAEQGAGPGRERGPRIGRRAGERAASRVQGPVVEQVIVSATLDPLLSLRALAGYSGLSVRKLRDLLADPDHPLPCYRGGGKILVRRSDFDQWAMRHRRVGGSDLDRIAEALVAELGTNAGRGRHKRHA